MSRKSKVCFSSHQKDILTKAYSEGMDSVGKDKADAISEIAAQLGKDPSEIKVMIYCVE